MNLYINSNRLKSDLNMSESFGLFISFAFVSFFIIILHLLIQIIIQINSIKPRQTKNNAQKSSFFKVFFDSFFNSFLMYVYYGIYWICVCIFICIYACTYTVFIYMYR